MDEHPSAAERPATADRQATADECAAVIAAAEGAAARNGGWLSTRHKHHPTVDMPLYDLPRPCCAAARRLFETVVLPSMQAQYATRPLRVREALLGAAQGLGRIGRRGRR